ncbi:SRPBCC domain-containing protein [Peredibacter sp. HCB2-198]|uniref:SRPBCC family protein n=1 Tax=Peredibacter sp. HCB2-198 TaxID=3383025 RepID=UPI0038B68515
MTSLTVKRLFTSKPEVVFDAFITPEKAGKFMFATKTGKMVKVVIEPKSQGQYVFIENRDGEEVEHLGTFLAVDRPYTLAFELRVPKYKQDQDKVIITLSPLNSGTELTLEHTLSDMWIDSKSAIEGGWREILEGVAEVLGEPFKKSLFVEKSIEINASSAKVWEVLKNPELNKKWISTWWPGTYAKSDWKLESPVLWYTENGEVGSEGKVTIIDPESIGFSFEVKGMPFKKVENIAYWVRELEKNKSKLMVWVGDFSDSPEHEACYPGADEAWNLSMPMIKQLAEKS